jgi:F-type H+-transporting ATPase subunit delta
MAQLTTLARPYAKAAFGTAESAGQLGAWSKSLGLLGTVVRDKKVAGFLFAPSRSTGEQAQALIDLCGAELDARVQSFVLVLAANKRLALLPEIVQLFEALKAEREKSIDVNVVSAFDMDAAAANQLAAVLKQRLQRDVKLTTTVDSSLIGGVVVRAGDLVIDNSVRGRLKKLAESMSV